MSESTPFAASGTAPPAPAPALDPLAGDWSEGLRPSARASGIPEPRLLALDGIPLPPPPAHAASEPPLAAPAPAEVVEAPDAWGANEDPLQSQPPPAPSRPEPPPSVIANVTGAFMAPSFQPDITPPSPAPSFQPDITPPSPAPSFPPEVAKAAEPEPAFKADITPAMAMPAPLIPPAPEDAAPAASAAEGVVELKAEDAAEAHAAPPAEPVMDLRAEDAAAPEAPSFHSPGSDADAWGSAIAAAPAPTPWSEQAPSKTAFEAVPPWEQVTAISPARATTAAAAGSAPAGEVVASEDVIWSAPPPAAEHVSEWKAEAPAGDWQEVKKAEAPPAHAAADWSTLSSGPDWSAPAAAAESAAPEEAWGSAPPPPAADEWSAAPAQPAESEWSAPPPAEEAPQTEWSAPAPAADESDWSATPPEPAAKPWGGPPAGASALEQLEADPEEPVQGAAADLFGSVPAGGSLAGDDEEPGDLGASEELAGPEDLGPPEELASPEDFLKPVEMSDDDADLLVPVEEAAPEPPPPPPPAAAKTLAMMAPVNPLEVRGEHRVAVHMRRGGTKRGSVRDVDLGKPQFPLIPQGGGAPESVYHAEVKAVFFMLAAGEKAQPGDGVKVKVTFADGRSIEGVRDGADSKPGFFLVPSDAARTNTRRIYVAREATSEIKNL